MARRSNQSILKEISPEYSLAIWCKELTHWKRPWCWGGLRAGGEGDNKGWDGWMASPTRWTRVRVNVGGWWRTGKPGVLQSMGSQWVRHDWAAEQHQPPQHKCKTVSELLIYIPTRNKFSNQGTVFRYSSFVLNITIFIEKKYNTVENTIYEARLPQFKSWLHHLLAEYAWMNC